MTTDTLTLKSGGSRMRLPGILSLALRELRGGLKGFYVFVACVALGVMVITGVGALSDALRVSLARQGERLLGGDFRLSRAHKPADAKERSFLAAKGRFAEMATMRAMARRPDLSEQTLVEIKAVDAAYPLVGKLALKNGADPLDALRRGRGAAVDPILLAHLKLKLGDEMTIGKARVAIKAVIEREPDRLSSRLSYGPRVMMSLDTLQSTGLVQPGSLIRWRYGLKLPDGRGDTAGGLEAAGREIKSGLAASGFIVRDRRNPSPFVSRTIDRLGQFLTLIGLTALLVGGVGVANAVSTFIDRRRKIIATYKSLGATGGLIFAVHLIQVMGIAALGVIIGLALGYLIPYALNAAFGALLPIKAEIAVTQRSAITASAYGFLVSLVFALWPLGRAEMVRAGVLFRDEVAPERTWPRPYVIILSVLVAAALIAFAIFTSESKRIAIYFCIGLVILFAAFLALGAGVTWAARRMPRSSIPELALAVGNLGAPGGLTRSVVLSLGAGLSLLVAVALADASLVEELSNRTPENAPNYFVLDIRKGDYPAFKQLVQGAAPGAEIIHAPMLRGRLIKLGGRPVETIKAPPEAAWVLRGDRGLSYAVDVPHGSKLVAGKWWAKDYDGEPLVSFEAELAGKLGVGIGDTVTVNVLGRNLTARIANLREVQWETLAINFVMVFSPNTLQSAPHALLATITMAKDTKLSSEAALAREIGRVFPAVTPIRVKDAINTFNTIFIKIMSAVRIAGSVTLLAGALVLAGALATAQRRRIHQAVILKALGATRRRILASHFAEYLILAAVTALIAVAFGTMAAYVTVTSIMDLQFTFSFPAVLQALGLSIGLVMLFGSFGTWRVLKAPAVPYLRAE